MYNGRHAFPFGGSRKTGNRQPTQRTTAFIPGVPPGGHALNDFEKKHAVNALLSMAVFNALTSISCRVARLIRRRTRASLTDRRTCARVETAFPFPRRRVPSRRRLSFALQAAADSIITRHGEYERECAVW